ncbi:MAG: hypothetical protein OQL19_21505 [Gammaproteobacteria bacterium]|nr:hypothetical protein [Gammaproteobacteria bacterium]
MNDIKDIKIVGMDENRPPQIRKEPYIDLFFKLSHKVPGEWCEEFNKLTAKLNPPVKIDTSILIYIETYVRDMADIPDLLVLIKKKIVNTSTQYIERQRQKTLADIENNASIHGQGGKQGQLNAIIKSLNFDN